MMLILLLNIFVISKADEYVLGADMSYLNTEDCYNTCSPYKETSNGATGDALVMLKNAGINTIRLRIFNNPAPPYGGTSGGCNLTDVLFMAKRIKNINLGFLLDFHYSDTWADPSHQTKPANWSNLHGNDLNKAVYDFTYNVLNKLKQQNTLPDKVQIGNEIDGGMLWAKSGEPVNYGGYIYSPYQSNWPIFADLIRYGVYATKNISSNIEIMIHTSMGNCLGTNNNCVNNIIDWYNNLLNVYNVKFDAIGLSYYPGWCQCSLSDLNKLSTLMNKFDDKNLYLAETSYPYNPSSQTWKGEYPFTEQGQFDYLKNLLNMLKNNTQIKNWKGIYWWGTEYYNQNPDDWAALWNQNAIALSALNAWK